MKYRGGLGVLGNVKSRPARGAWIEIGRYIRLRKSHPGRAPQGARGLKLALERREVGGALVAPRKGRVD